MFYGIIAGICVVMASVFGSLIGLALKKITHRQNDIMLGFAAGVMLGAAFIGLLPGIFIQGELFHNLVGVAGILFGALIISLLDKFIPHEHGDMEEFNEPNKKNALLLVLAIAIHNIPEGLATGIVFSDGMTAEALLVAISMVIQKIPEGLIIVIPLLHTGISRTKAFWYSTGVAFLMLPGVIIGTVLGGLPAIFSKFFYAFTFGAIIYVISDEIIPESHEHGYQKAATFALIIGILTVILLQ